MNVLLIGSGGREHAIAKKVAESKSLDNFYCIPGNPGIQNVAQLVDINPADHTKIIEFAKNNNIDLLICGPEQPLVDGLADAVSSEGIPVFGPKKSGAILEGSKIYSKQFMKKYSIPTAPFKVFDNYEKACEYISGYSSYPVVIKADGLAAGKGVKIAKSKEDALETLKEYMIDKTFGDAGTSVLIEEFMTGEEMSFLYITDGSVFLPLLPAKDYKKAYDNDEGENTGGMGCYAPHQSITDSLKETIERTIVDKVKQGINAENIDYRGVLYIGLMLTDEGPKVVEFNCRFGDPETQVILPLIDSDLLQIIYEAAQCNLKEDLLAWKKDYAACVVLASEGYPKQYEKGKQITFETSPYDYIHAGTKSDGTNFYTNGGRVLNAVALGNSKEEALKNAYALLNKVNFDNSFYRTDIGK